MNLGSGETRYPGYINCDRFHDSDLSLDIRHLPIRSDTVEEISIHHVLEHIPQIEIEPTLKEFYRVLKPGGVLDIGMPDIDLCCQKFLDSNDYDKWEYMIWLIFGQEIDMKTNELDPGQFHQAGLTIKKAGELLRQTGFEIIETYNYDGNGTPSLFAFAQKN